MTDLVVISLEKWDGVWRRNQHLINGLLERDPSLRVLFVEPAADPVYAARRRSFPRGGVGLRLVEAHEGASWPGRLWSFQPTKWLPRRIYRGVDERLAQSVIGAAARLGMSDPVLWVNDPFGAQILRLTGWTSLYDITDDWLLADRGPHEEARIARQEAYLLQECVEVVVCSPQLKRDKGSVRTVRLVANAVDLAAYRSVGPRPTDLPDGPVVLYVGTLHRDRLDVDLCLKLASRIKGKATLVFVGPVALDGQDQRRLRAAGANLLGARNARQVPRYLSHSDILVVPHVVTPFTESLDPIKAYEYRASGRPVVSTAVAGFRSQDSDAISCSSSSEQFVRDVCYLLDNVPVAGFPPEGVPDWSVRVSEFQSILHRLGPV